MVAVQLGRLAPIVSRPALLTWPLAVISMARWLALAMATRLPSGVLDTVDAIGWRYYGRWHVGHAAIRAATRGAADAAIQTLN